MGNIGNYEIGTNISMHTVTEQAVSYLYFSPCAKGDQIADEMGGTFSTDCDEEIYMYKM